MAEICDSALSGSQTNIKETAQEIKQGKNPMAYVRSFLNYLKCDIIKLLKTQNSISTFLKYIFISQK